MYKIKVADWRKDTTGPMQVVSGGMGKEKVYFQAPDSSLVENEMHQFLDWFNNNTKVDWLKETRELIDKYFPEN